MARIKIDTDHRVSYNENDRVETTLAKDYAIRKREHSTKPKKTRVRGTWTIVPGEGRAGFAGSGMAVYQVVHPDLDNVVYRVQVNRYADGRSFYATTHTLSCSIVLPRPRLEVTK